MKVLILGAKGNLGSELVRAFSEAGHAVDGTDREELDVTDADAVRARIMDGGYGAVVNAVAWNDVDGAEDPAKQPLVTMLNATAPGVMATAARDAGAAFVHYSTDYVFDGTKREGYVETDEPTPISLYGASKAAGERATLAAAGRSYLVRTSKIFGPQGPSPAAKPSFVAVMVKLATTKPELSIVDEEVGMPTFTRDVAEATVRLLDGSFAPGIYHFVNEGPGVTWYGFAEEFFGLLGITTPRKPVPMSAFPRPAKRPLFAALRNTKFPPLRPRIEALKAFLQEGPAVR
jgi:dTDP-4-dehydrorhamnose reductase